MISKKYELIYLFEIVYGYTGKGNRYYCTITR